MYSCVYKIMQVLVCVLSQQYCYKYYCKYMRILLLIQYLVLFCVLLCVQLCTLAYTTAWNAACTAICTAMCTAPRITACWSYKLINWTFRTLFRSCSMLHTHIHTHTECGSNLKVYTNIYKYTHRTAYIHGFAFLSYLGACPLNLADGMRMGSSSLSLSSWFTRAGWLCASMPEGAAGSALLQPSDMSPTPSVWLLSCVADTPSPCEELFSDGVWGPVELEAEAEAEAEQEASLWGSVEAAGEICCLQESDGPERRWM